MNVKIPAAKDEPKELLTAKTPMWFTRVSASHYINSEVCKFTNGIEGKQ